MGKKEFEECVRLVDTIKGQVMLDSVSKAKQDGLKPMFAGFYQLGYKGTKKELDLAFVIALTPEQERKLDNGILEGRIYEATRYTTFEGTITTKSVKFVKKFGPESSFGNLASVLGISPSQQEYSGSFDERGHACTGTFKFKNLKNSRDKQGTFYMEML